MEEEHPNRVVFTLPEPEKVNEGVDAGGKGPIQPSSTLGNEFGNSLGDVSFGLGGFDIRQRPVRAGLGHKFETQDSIFGKEHVLLEDVHALNALFPEARSEGMVAVEILFEGTSEDGLVAVCGKGTREDRDIAKGRFKRFIKDIGDFVLKILGGDEGIEEFSTVFPEHRMDFTTGPAEVLLIVECKPEFVDTF